MDKVKFPKLTANLPWGVHQFYNPPSYWYNVKSSVASHLEDSIGTDDLWLEVWSRCGGSEDF